MKKLIATYLSFFLASLFFNGNLQAQDSTIFSFTEFMDLVKKEHPLSAAAALSVEKGQANLRSSRGGFDPVLYQNTTAKDYDNQEYYQIANLGLKIPTWFGIDVEGGLQQNSGNYLNPQNNLPDNGLFFAGITAPIGQGLFMDKRRQALRKAQLYLEMSELERRLLLNNLLLEAGKSYWDWFIAYNKVLIFEDALVLAEIRFEAVQQGAKFGDRASLDTVEAGIQVQTRMVMLQEARLEFLNTGALLSTYLWQNGNIPLEIKENTVPSDKQNVENQIFDMSLEADNKVTEHPLFEQRKLEISQLEIDKKWQREKLKPVLNLKYNLLAENQPSWTNEMSTFNNYTWGVEFKMPIFLRKERGDLRMANLRLQEANLKLQPTEAKLKFNIQKALNEWEISRQQILVTEQMVADYSVLLNGERQLFNAGESSLFLVNSRELGYISSKVKLIELIGKNQKAAVSTRFALGTLSDGEM